MSEELPITDKPRSLKSDAEKATDLVTELSGDFTDQYHETMKKRDEVNNETQVVQGIVKRGLSYLDRARALLEKKGVDPKAAQEKIKKARVDRDQSLYTEDFKAVRDFYEKITLLIASRGRSDRGGITNNEFVHEVIELFKSDPIWEKLMKQKNFEPTLRTMLSGKMTEVEIDAFEDELIAAIPEPNIAHAIENIFMNLRPLCGEDGTLIPLTEKSIPGMMGHVLSEEDADKIFAGDFSPFEKVDSGEIQLHFADRTISFYHVKGQRVIPEEATVLLKNEMPSKVLFSPYRTDTDMRDLFADMSDDQQLIGTERVTNASLVIEGLSNNDDIIFVQVPSDWDDAKKKLFLQTPLQFMNSDFKFKNADAVKASKEKAINNEQKLLEDKSA